MNPQHLLSTPMGSAHHPDAMDLRQGIFLWILVALFAVLVANVLAAGM